MNITLLESTDKAALRRLLMRTGGLRKSCLRMMLRASFFPLLLFVIYYNIGALEGVAWFILAMLPYNVLMACLRFRSLIDSLVDSCLSSSRIELNDDGFDSIDESRGMHFFIHGSQMIAYQLDVNGLIVYGAKGGIILMHPFSSMALSKKESLIAALHDRLDTMIAQSEAQPFDATEESAAYGELLYTNSELAVQELSHRFILRGARHTLPYALLLGFVIAMVLPCLLSPYLHDGLLKMMLFVFVFVIAIVNAISWWIVAVPKAKPIKGERAMVPLLRYARVEGDCLMTKDSRGTNQSIPLSIVDECECLEHSWLLKSRGITVCCCNPAADFEFLKLLPKKQHVRKPTCRQIVKATLLVLLYVAVVFSLSYGLVELLAALR